LVSGTVMLFEAADQRLGSFCTDRARKVRGGVQPCFGRGAAALG